jgi:hypothetical protein
MSSANTQPASSNTRRIFFVIILFLLAGYALQVFSPIRLCYDATVLLSMGESAAYGGGFLDHGVKTVFPPGYPAALAVLLRMGLGHPSAIIGLNLVLLVVGLLGTYRVLRDGFFDSQMAALLVCTLSLLSYVLIKHFTMPLSDVAFLGITMSCLALMSHASRLKWGTSFVGWAAASWVLVVVAISVRRIGVSLIPAFLFLLVSRPEIRPMLKRISPRAKWIAALIVLAAVLGTAIVVSTTSTLGDLTVQANRSGISRMMLQIASFRGTELGELATNIPAAKLPAAARRLVPWIGFAALLPILAGLFTKRRTATPVDVYFASYLGILFLWPYYDARFWLPVIPLLLAYSGLAIARLKNRGLVRTGVAIYGSVFAILGVIALVYSTRISFAGPRFPDVYGDGTLRPSYCAVFHTCAGTIPADRIDPKVVEVLQRYR